MTRSSKSGGGQQQQQQVSNNTAIDGIDDFIEPRSSSSGGGNCNAGYFSSTNLGFYVAIFAFLVAVCIGIYFWNENKKVMNHLQVIPILKKQIDTKTNEISKLTKQVYSLKSTFDQLVEDDSTPTSPTPVPAQSQSSEPAPAAAAAEPASTPVSEK
jgi:hypothetical protein